LVDELGDQNRALELASELGKVPRRVVFQRPRRGFLQRFLPFGVASTMVNEAYIRLEELLLQDLTVQVRT
jgi:ClpP class serine protease